MKKNHTDACQNAANYVSETIQGAGATASKEANKNVAKDSDAKLSTRANAAVDAVTDKKDEHVHDVKADVHKGELPCPRMGSRVLSGANDFAEAAKH